MHACIMHIQVSNNQRQYICQFVQMFSLSLSLFVPHFCASFCFCFHLPGYKKAFYVTFVCLTSFPALFVFISSFGQFHCSFCSYFTCPLFLSSHIKMSLTASVTSKKSPNVYKSCPKMISLEK